jgi:hypothetical protein
VLLLLAAHVLVTSQSARAQELVDYATIKDLVLDQVSRANKAVTAFPPPKFKIKTVMIEMHVTQQASIGGGISLKVPLLIDASISPTYESIQTTLEPISRDPR